MDLMKDATAALGDIQEGRVMTPAEAKQALRRRHSVLGQ
jgi:hypothetical protein